MTFRNHYFFLILIFFSCSDKPKQRILVDDVFAVGDINKDTVYNGVIKFYDTANNKLVMSANYKEGVLDGERINYYPNGKIESKLIYVNGEQHGELITFDSMGNVTLRQTFFHGLRAGSSLSFKNGASKQYYFYSLENNELLHIDYDSIAGKRIEQLNDTDFFFWHLNDFIMSDSDEKRKELFIYIPDPPKLNFRYSLCVIDAQYNITKVVKEFDEGKIWDLITLNYQNLKDGELFAIRLKVDNEFATEQKEAIMFKKL